MKTLLLLLAITLGALFPYGHEYTFLIRYFLMLMLFFPFLDVRFDKRIIRKSHFVILGTIISASVIIYFLLKPFNQILAETAFVTAIAPTAIAAPVIISLKNEKVEFVTFSLLLNNIAVALLLPKRANRWGKKIIRSLYGYRLHLLIRLRCWVQSFMCLYKIFISRGNYINTVILSKSSIYFFF
jgi:hypothetical protein